MNINLKQYRDRQFVFAFDFQKVSDSSFTGLNLRAGQMMRLIVKPAGALFLLLKCLIIST